MKRVLVSLAAMTFALSASEARASAASDAFGRCLVQSSSGRDRTTFIRWMFAALSVNPEVKALGAATDEQRTAISKQAAQLMERLVLVDCRQEAIAAIRADGQQALATSFEVFGRSAASELMSDPAVTKQMGAIDDYTDNAKWSALIEEAKKK